MSGIKIQNLIIKKNIWELVKITPFVIALHEFEEWNVLSWHQKYQSNIPDVIDLHLRTIFLIIIAIVFLYFYIAAKIKNRKTAAYMLLPLLSVFLYNGLVHLYWSFYFTSYAPGLVFGFFVGVPLIGIIIYKFISEKLVSKWYAMFWGIVFSTLLVNIIIMGDKLEPFIVNSMLLGKSLSELIWF